MELDHADPGHAGHLHHIELYTADLERSLPFWEWLLDMLGYEAKNDWDAGRSWRKGPTYLVLVQADRTDPDFVRTTPGLNHLAFHARSRAQVDELTAAVRSRPDAKVLYEDQHPYAGDYYAVYCEGPEGLKIEVVGPEEE